jgi:hypothetical protein
MSDFGLTTAWGDMQDPPAAVENSKKKVVAGQDAAAMEKLMKDIKSGFGERNPGVASNSFDRAR